MTSKMKKLSKALFSLLLLLAVLFCGCDRLYKPPLEDSSLQVSADSSAPAEETTEEPSEETAEETSGESLDLLRVHFLDVGQADAALVTCGEEAMLIDGGNRGDSSLLFSYISEQGIDHLEYVIATHPHEDHIGGLPGALNAATAGTVYSPVTEYGTDVFANLVKYTEKAGAVMEVPRAGDTFELGSATVQILACNAGKETNDSSIVLRISHGDNSFLFTGDAERAAEQYILNSGYDIASTVLKVGHHGSDSSTSYLFLREVMPRIAVISVGEGNSYGHPDETVLSRLEDADVTVYRTDRDGTVVIESDGSGDVKIVPTAKTSLKAF